MASVKVKFRLPSSEGQEGRLIFQVIHEQSVRQWVSDYCLRAEEWDERKGGVIGEEERGKGVRRDLERFRRVIREMEDGGGSFSAEDVVGEFCRRRDEQWFFGFMERIICRLRDGGRLRTSETYRAALASLRRFRCGRDVMFDCFDGELMEQYEGWLLSRGLIPNTVSFYMRILRAVYNRGVERGITDDRRPFSRVSTGVYRTVKRAVDVATLRRMRELDLRGEPMAEYARDIFMLSFYLRGMSFVDMAFLRRSDLEYGYVCYRRRKTGQRLMVKWTGEMQGIVDRYPYNETGYLLPIVTRNDIGELGQYRSRQYLVNKWLKRVGERLGLRMPLTLYCSRHSWASIARERGIPIGVISDGLGHESEHTTQIYLSTLDTSAVDQANDMIIGLL